MSSRYRSDRRSGASQGATRTRSPRATWNPRVIPSMGPTERRRSTANFARGRIGRSESTSRDSATDTTISPTRGATASATRTTIGLPATSTRAFGVPNRRDWPPTRMSAVSMEAGIARALEKGLRVISRWRPMERQARNDKADAASQNVASKRPRTGVRRVSPVPFGLGFTKPHNYREVLRSVWNNKHAPFFARRILRDGVCDGCALGTTGLRDFTMEGIHLCTVRLDLLPLNTMGALRPRILRDVTALRSKSSKALRQLGRLPSPMVRSHGEPGFRRISWEEALQTAAARIRATTPDRIAFFITSRGMTNESYYVANKVARFLGTNNIDNSSRPCHSPSTTGLKETIGVAASTCSYTDWIGSDLIVFFGSDVPNNQPVTMKYLYYAKKMGTKIAIVNPMREPGLARYWVPSVPDSAVWGTRFADEFFAVHTGGDIAFINGVLKHLIDNRWIDEPFVEKHTTGFYHLRVQLASLSWDELERQSGVTRDRMLAFARMYHEARTAVFVWSMGITHHRFGVDNVKAIVNLGLARGIVGREKCGLMPIRGHSGVQGGSEMGAQPAAYGLGFPVDDANA